MSYDTIATFSQVTTLLLFVALFMLVLVYVFLPRNRARFEKAARDAIDLAPEKSKAGGRQ